MSFDNPYSDIDETNIDLSDNDYIKDLPKKDTDCFDETSNKISEENFQKNFLNLNSIESYNDNNEGSISIPATFKPRKKTRDKKSKKIFDFKKIKKNVKNGVKKGRKKRGEKITTETKHDKNGSDNIKIKIKKSFIEKMRNHLNNLYKKYTKEKSEKFLYKIKADFIQCFKKNKKKMNVKKSDDLPITLGQLFSSNLNDKFKRRKKDYNKNKIKKLYQEDKVKEIIELLDKTVQEAYEIYINNKIPECSLKSDMNKLKEEGNDEEYLKKYEEQASNLTLIYEIKGKNDFPSITDKTNETD